VKRLERRRRRTAIPPGYSGHAGRPDGPNTPGLPVNFLVTLPCTSLAPFCCSWRCGCPGTPASLWLGYKHAGDVRGGSHRRHARRLDLGGSLGKREDNDGKQTPAPFPPRRWPCLRQPRRLISAGSGAIGTSATRRPGRGVPAGHSSQGETEPRQPRNFVAIVVATPTTFGDRQRPLGSITISV
jgi:hypothetical protein